MAGSWQGAETFPSFNPIKQRELLSRAWGCVSSRGGPRGGGAVVALEVGDFAAPRGRPRPRSVSAPPMAAAGRGGHRRPHTMAQTKADPICNSTRGRGPPRPAAAGTPAAVGSECWGVGGGAACLSFPGVGRGRRLRVAHGKLGAAPTGKVWGAARRRPPQPRSTPPGRFCPPRPCIAFEGHREPPGRAGRAAESPGAGWGSAGGSAVPARPVPSAGERLRAAAGGPSAPRPPPVPVLRSARCCLPCSPSSPQFVPVPPRPAPSRCGSGGSRSCVRGVPAGRACVHTCAMRVGRVCTCARAMCVGVRSCVCMYA